MRRELLIAAAVLVPFAVLVAAGFYFEPKPVTPGEFPLPRGGAGQGEGKPLPASPVDAGSAPSSTPLGQTGVVAKEPDLPRELRAPLLAVLPEVRQCFVDQHLKSVHPVKVHFTPTRDGGFTSVTVDEQNPYLQACLEDVFSEVTWTPAGPEIYQPAEHVFDFAPAP